MNENINNGGFIVARKLFKSELWNSKPSTWKVLWIYILGNVSHKDEGHFKRGRGFFMFSRDRDLIGCDISRDTIKKAVQYFKKNEMIRTKRSTRGMYIEVLNYNKYQTFNNYKSTNESTKKAPRKHPDTQECKNGRR